MLNDYQVMTGFFLVTMISGLLIISYWAGVLDIEDYAEEDDFFSDL